MSNTEKLIKQLKENKDDIWRKIWSKKYWGNCWRYRPAVGAVFGPIRNVCVIRNYTQLSYFMMWGNNILMIRPLFCTKQDLTQEKKFGFSSFSLDFISGSMDNFRFDSVFLSWILRSWSAWKLSQFTSLSSLSETSRTDRFLFSVLPASAASACFSLYRQMGYIVMMLECPPKFCFKQHKAKKLWK